METNLKKLLAIVGVACLSITSVFAQEMNATMNQPQNNNQEVNYDGLGICPARCAVPCGKYCPGECGPMIFVSAAYTLWTARQAGLAVADGNYYNPTTTSPEAGRTWYPRWRLRSGFKVDVGVFLDHDCWDAVIEYTWFWNRNNKVQVIEPQPMCAPGTLYSTWTVCECPCRSTSGALMSDLTQVILTSAARKWDLWLNRIDGQLGRTFFVGHFTTLRPFLGLLGAWDDQKFDIDYTAANGDQFAWINHQKWWGVGPYGGFEPAFTFPPGDQCNMWSIFLDSGIAMLWGRFHANHLLNEVIPVAGAMCETTNFTQAAYIDIFHTITPMIELALGLRWETWMESGWYFLIQAAWETQCYFEHNHFRPMGTAQQGHGNLTLQGFTLKAKVGF